MTLARQAIEEHGAWQKVVELEALALMVATLRPHRVLEIGTHKGGTLWLWSQLAADDALLVSVDLDHETVWAAMNADERLREDLRPLIDQERLFFVEGDSSRAGTQRAVERLFGGESVDLLFIDGGHSYLAALVDWYRYSGLVGKGGLIVLHDTREADNAGVDQLWAELKEQYETTTEIVATDPSRWGGISVVRV
jgi:predicted O-methyltransferase YrrM